MAVWNLDYTPTEKQAILHSVKATQIFYGGAAGGAKLLTLRERIPTPSGWVTMGEVSVGQEVFDETGSVCVVTDVWPVNESPELFEFTFDDGTKIVSCVDHQWVTLTASDLSALSKRTDEYRASRRGRRASRATAAITAKKSAWLAEHNAAIGASARKPLPVGTVKTTREIVETLFVRGKRANHAIPVCEYIQAPEASLPIDPYVLGAWLGDGTAANGHITGIDDEIFSEIQRRGFPVIKLKCAKTRNVFYLSKLLRECGLIKNKHIPAQYLRASREQRLDLIKGLMDTDGTVAKPSMQPSFTNTNKSIIDGVCEVIASMGWKYHCSERRAKLYGKDCGPSWTIRFSPSEKVFVLPRKRDIQAVASRRTTRYRYIVSAVAVPSEPGRCIAVSSRSKLFLAGPQMVPTHNSHGLRMDGLIACLQNPGCKAYLFRKTMPEIDDNHVAPLKSMFIPPDVATFHETRKSLVFTNGSVMRFCFSEDDETIHKFLGAEIHWLGVDEATRMTPYQLKFLISRVRLGGWKPGQGQDGYFPRIVFASNPGGPSHSYLKRKFIDVAPPMTYFQDKSTAKKDGTGGWRSIFIPSKMDDNPHLDKDMYEGAFTGMAPEQAKALRDGDWDSVAGAAFFNLSREKHMLRPFLPPRHWTHFSSIDWGTYKPFSIGWYAVSEGALLEEKDGWPETYIPPGAIVRFAEYYGWNGEPDNGCRLESPAVARAWLAKEEEMGLPPMDFRVGDSQMWAQMDGPSVVERMREASGGRVSLRQGRRDRRANYAEFIARLGVQQCDNGVFAPLFFITANCEHFWRTVPALLLDANEPDKGPATRGQEDHCLAAGTRVLTKRGKQRIETVWIDDEVWTPAGWRRVLLAGSTGRSEIWRITAQNGVQIEATSSHPFLTKRGWVRLDELRFDDYVVCLFPGKENGGWLNTSMARRIGFAATITSVTASACIGLCGSTITDLSKRAGMFITKMAIGLTTRLRTLSFFRPESTSAITCDSPTGLLTQEKQSDLLRKLPKHGTAARKERLGTPSTQAKSCRGRQDFLTHAKFAVKSFWQKLVDDASARLGVASATFELGIRDITRTGRVESVYNLKVDGVPTFTVACGVVVHNCADECSFAMSMRPIITTKRQRDEMDFQHKLEQYGVTRSGDPYANL